MTFAEVQAQVTLLKHQHRVWSHLHDQLSAYLDVDIGKAKTLEQVDTCAVRFVPKEQFYVVRDEIRDRLEALEAEIAKYESAPMQVGGKKPKVLSLKQRSARRRKSERAQAEEPPAVAPTGPATRVGKRRTSGT